MLLEVSLTKATSPEQLLTDLLKDNQRLLSEIKSQYPEISEVTLTLEQGKMPVARVVYRGPDRTQSLRQIVLTEKGWA